MTKPIFISFAIEDRHLRDFLVGQKNNEKSDIEFRDMSVKKAWDSAWKTKCRERIKECKGVVGIITTNTKKADGQLWELKCAYEEGIPVLLIWGSPTNRPTYLPAPISGRKVYNWTWDRVSGWINGL